MATKVYIAGKITGDMKYREKFAVVENALRRDGHIVLNPAGLPYGMSRADYMRICIAMIDQASVALFMPDWKESEGAKVERAYCEYVGKEIVELPESAI